MRKFLILTISLLAPYALYTAGCNQNRQAAFPTTPEMNALARAPEQDAPTRPPYIPAAAIDREVLASANDAATHSRLQAVSDRSNTYAYSHYNSQPGLFVLPPENSQFPEPVPTMAAAPNAAPVPSVREFWSRPMAPIAQPRQQQAQIHQDIYAMAPAQPPMQGIPTLPALGFEPLPEPITLGPAIPTAAPDRKSVV